MIIEIFGEGNASQKKGCPRNTFLGLCEEGLRIKGSKNIIRKQYRQGYKAKKFVERSNWRSRDRV